MATNLALRSFALATISFFVLAIAASTLQAQPGRDRPPQQQPIYELRFVNHYDFPVLFKFVGFQNAANYTTPIGPGESVRQDIYAGQRVACLWDMQGNLLMHDVVVVDRHGVINFGAPAPPQSPPDVVPAVGGPPVVGGPPAVGGQPSVDPQAGRPGVVPPQEAAGAGTPIEQPTGPTTPRDPATGAGAAGAEAAGGAATPSGAAGASGGGLRVEQAPAADPAAAGATQPAAGGGLTIEAEPQATPSNGGQTP